MIVIENYLTKKINKAIQIAEEKALKEVLLETFKVAIPYFIKDYEAMYHEGVDSFYFEYSPIRYKRKHSLFELIEIQKKSDYGFVVEINDKKATRFHDGEDTVYDLTFHRGYHGGAYDEETGRMRYRGGAGWTHWGRDAVRGEPILDRIKNKIQKYAPEKVFVPIFKKVYMEKYNSIFEQEFRRLMKG